MNEYCLNRKNIETYLQYLREQEKSAGTLEKYKRELYELLSFLSGKNESKEELILWKAQLEQKYRPAGDNGRLVAANGFFSFLVDMICAWSCCGYRRRYLPKRKRN